MNPAFLSSSYFSEWDPKTCPHFSVKTLIFSAKATVGNYGSLGTSRNCFHWRGPDVCSSQELENLKDKEAFSGAQWWVVIRDNAGGTKGQYLFLGFWRAAGPGNLEGPARNNSTWGRDSAESWDSSNEARSDPVLPGSADISVLSLPWEQTGECFDCTAPRMKAELMWINLKKRNQ